MNLLPIGTLRNAVLYALPLVLCSLVGILFRESFPLPSFMGLVLLHSTCMLQLPAFSNGSGPCWKLIGIIVASLAVPIALQLLPSSHGPMVGCTASILLSVFLVPVLSYRRIRTLVRSRAGVVMQLLGFDYRALRLYCGIRLLCPLEGLLLLGLVLREEDEPSGLLLFLSGVVLFFILAALFNLPSLTESSRISSRTASARAMESIIPGLRAGDDSDPSAVELCMTCQRLISKEASLLDPTFGPDDLCRSLGTDMDTVSKALGKCLGMTAATFISYHRIQRCLDLVMEGEIASLEDLSRKCGFSSQEDMGTAFFHVTGCSLRLWWNRLSMTEKKEDNHSS